MACPNGNGVVTHFHLRLQSRTVHTWQFGSNISRTLVYHFQVSLSVAVSSSQAVSTSTPQ
jgi:hypothetical protein